MRVLARKPDGPDPRDRRYYSSQMSAAMFSPPQTSDLRYGLPECWDQGSMGGCGAHGISALMCFLRRSHESFSRQQIYYCTRQIENDVTNDSGVQTRDLFKVLRSIGAAEEALWPYTADRLFAPPPAPVLASASRNRIGSYNRLVAEDDFVGCLSEGFPFVIGFSCFQSFTENALARTGVMCLPDPRREQWIGGHVVVAVGHDLKFRSSAAFKKSGVDTTLVSDHALLMRNSWGKDWGIQGHFWMPMSYAVNPSIGGDSWTGRL